MSTAGTVASGVLGGAVTTVARSVTRRALHHDSGAPRIPQAARSRHGIGTMLAWAAALGMLLAVADIVREQRHAAAPGT